MAITSKRVLFLKGKSIRRSIRLRSLEQGKDIVAKDDAFGRPTIVLAGSKRETRLLFQKKDRRATEAILEALSWIG